MVASARCSGARLKLRRAALQHVGIRDDDLFAALAAQARALDPDVLDGARKGVHHQVVADPEGLVERDGQRGEQIHQHALQGERDGDAADSQAGEQGGDVDAEIVEGDQYHQRPDQHSRDEIDDVQRTREHLVRAALLLLGFQIEADRPSGPQADLHQDENQHGVPDDVLNLVRQRQAGLGGIQRNGEEQELPGVAGQIGDEPDGQALLRGRVLLIA